MGTALIVLKIDGRVVLINDCKMTQQGDHFQVHHGKSLLLFHCQEVIAAGDYPDGQEAVLQADLRALMAGAKKRKR